MSWLEFFSKTNESTEGLAAKVRALETESVRLQAEREGAAEELKQLRVSRLLGSETIAPKDLAARQARLNELDAEIAAAEAALVALRAPMLERAAAGVPNALAAASKALDAKQHALKAGAARVAAAAVELERALLALGCERPDPRTHSNAETWTMRAGVPYPLNELVTGELAAIGGAPDWTPGTLHDDARAATRERDRLHHEGVEVLVAAALEAAGVSAARRAEWTAAAKEADQVRRAPPPKAPDPAKVIGYQLVQAPGRSITRRDGSTPEQLSAALAALTKEAKAHGRGWGVQELLRDGSGVKLGAFVFQTKALSPMQLLG